MIQVFLVQSEQMLEITDLTESVDWSGAKTKAPRSVSLSMMHTDRGSHQPIKVQNGDGLVLRLDKKELFRGVVFSLEFSANHLSVTAYDPMIYLTNNKDSYLFTSNKASAILTKICGDFGLKTGEIADTKYVISYLVCNGDSLYDMVKKALATTYKHTGKRFTLLSREGKIHLIPRVENVRKWVIESGVNLIDYSFSRSIEETKTKVKLQTGEEKQTIIATAENKSLQKQFGVLQHYEKVGEKLKRAQLQERANQILAKEGKEKRSFKLNNLLGIPDVVTGSAIHVIIPELDIKQVYSVEDDKHTFTGKKHMMSLTLTEID